MHVTEREEPEAESQNFFYTSARLGMISHSYTSHQDHSLMWCQAVWQMGTHLYIGSSTTKLLHIYLQPLPPAKKNT